MDSLLFHLMDEFLFSFSAEPFFIPRKVKIRELDIILIYLTDLLGEDP